MRLFKKLFDDPKRIYTTKDCTTKGLLEYSQDHKEAAKKLFELSGRMNWGYLLSAAYLSHLSVELLLKAALLHFNGKFKGTHNLNDLFRQLKKKGMKISKESKECLNFLNRCYEARYPTSEPGPEINSLQWVETETLIDELRATVPKEIRNQMVELERFPENVRSRRILG